MLDVNIVYIYDDKLEHNGPYKDLVKAEVQGFRDGLGTKIEFNKVARGIYKLTSIEKLKTVTLTLKVNKKLKDIKIKHE